MLGDTPPSPLGSPDASQARRPALVAGELTEWPVAGKGCVLELSWEDPLLILAVVLLAGSGLGGVARRLRLPSPTGQILAGVLLGPAVLDLFSDRDLAALAPLTDFALALIGVTVGAHLNLRRLRNAGRRLALLLVSEALIIPWVVGLFLLALSDAPLSVILLLGPLALATAPATIVAVVRESRARGVFVKTLIAAVAINNLTSILLFELAHSVSALVLQDDFGFSSLTDPALLAACSISISQLAGGILVGLLAALVVHLLAKRIIHHERLTTVSAIAILFTTGLASALDLSPLLAAMALGVVQTNLNPARDRLVDSVFANFEPAILCVFFTLAGSHLRIDQAGAATSIALVFFAARCFGKMISARIAMQLAHATQGVRDNLGLALLPQAGVAIGLVIVIEEDPRFDLIEPLFVAVVLTSVTLNEILGPIATRFALARAGEVDSDRPRLIDFLQEENIRTDLEAVSMEDAIRQLTDLLVDSHELRAIDREALVQSVLTREAEVSTCVGGGLAVPHGELPEGVPMVGVMGVCRGGLAFDTPDGQPIHCIVLLATPRGERDRHLAVLAALARKIGTDATVQRALYSATTAAHVYQILHDDEEDLNYFLDDAEDDQLPPTHSQRYRALSPHGVAMASGRRGPSGLD